jgi:hypothetical protein
LFQFSQYEPVTFASPYLRFSLSPIMAFGSGRQWNHYNFFICWLVSLGQIAFGYPASIIGVTLAQPSFLVSLEGCMFDLDDSS